MALCRFALIADRSGKVRTKRSEKWLFSVFVLLRDDFRFRCRVHYRWFRCE